MLDRRYHPPGQRSIRASCYERAILYYAGDGLFCYSHDYLNMTYIGETMKAMAWKPPAGFNMPPRKPNWSTELPHAWRQLPDAFASDKAQ